MPDRPDPTITRSPDVYAWRDDGSKTDIWIFEEWLGDDDLDEGDYHHVLPASRTDLGGPGSGHHGHAGVPGQRGGSAPGEGGARTVEAIDDEMDAVTDAALKAGAEDSPEYTEAIQRLQAERNAAQQSGRLAGPREQRQADTEGTKGVTFTKSDAAGIEKVGVKKDGGHVVITTSPVSKDTLTHVLGRRDAGDVAGQMIEDMPGDLRVEWKPATADNEDDVAVRLQVTRRPDKQGGVFEFPSDVRPPCRWDVERPSRVVRVAEEGTGAGHREGGPGGQLPDLSGDGR